MSVNRIPIKDFLQHSGQIIIDVRSPGEYNHAHMPGAVNIPLFTDEERKVVGTAYKQQSRETAIKIGLDYFGPKMRKVVEEVESLIGSKQSAIGSIANCQLPTANSVLLYCWRGGMRSGAVSWLLNLYGFNVVVLASGYKAYRNHVLQQLAKPYRLNVLGGYTGSGKTELLHELKKRGDAIIDLEALALHKGSAFGNIGLPPQPPQEMFENLLAAELSKIEDESIWIEDESQRIGLINIPSAFWQTLRNSKIFFLDVSFEERLTHIITEYGSLDKEILGDAIRRISKRLGGLETKNALQHLQENNIKDCFAILLKYYDKHYLKGLHNREGLSSLLTKIQCHKTGAHNADLLPIKLQPA